jgi:hypothetical protein
MEQLLPVSVLCVAQVSNQILKYITETLGDFVVLFDADSVE